MSWNAAMLSVLTPARPAALSLIFLVAVHFHPLLLSMGMKTATGTLAKTSQPRHIDT